MSVPEETYGGGFLVVREPLFIAGTLTEEVSLWARKRHGRILRKVRKTAKDIGLRLRDDHDLSQLSSGQRAILGLLLVAEFCRPSPAKTPVLMYRIDSFLSADWRRRVEDWSAQQEHITLHRVAAGGEVVGFV